MSRAPRRARGWCRGAVAVAGAVVALFASAIPARAAANTEPFAASQWALKQVRAETAWDVTRGQGARVGIVDTGVDLGHIELAGRVVASTRCMGTGGQVPRCAGSAQDDSGHGTHVAGVIAAPLDGIGIAGVAPEASLLVVKVLAADGSGEVADAAAGIDWLISQRVDVVNLSLSETPSVGRLAGSPLESAIRRASAAGAVVVLAAGNDLAQADGAAVANLPAIVVGATNRQGRLAPYSLPLTSGVRWGLVAPGGDSSAGVDGDVVSTFWFAGQHNAYAWSEGTSMAAPHVAGVAALLAAQGIRGDKAVNRILSTAAANDCGSGCRGRLDAAAAVGAVRISPPPTTAAPVPVPVTQPPNGVAAAARPIPVTTLAPTVPATTAAPPATAPPTSAPVPVVPNSGLAVAPADRPVELRASPVSHRDAEVGAAVAAAALLAVAAATAYLSRRRLRADARR